LVSGLVALLIGAPAPSAVAADDDIEGVGTVLWGPCENARLVRFNAECGLLSVPLDYDEPDGTKISLALSRVRHTVPHDRAQGIMLVNPGGPGAPGLVLSTLVEFVPDAAGAAYDWIGFDPRGVGASEPALRCDPDYFAGPRPDYEPTTPGVEAAWLQRAATYAQACGENGGELLEHIKSTDTVRDMNAIRSALGEEQINYYGFSYGTYLGQVFATLFPSKVRRMVWDSNVDPRRVWYEANLDQNPAFEAALQLFFDWVARHEEAYRLGSTPELVEKQYYAARDDLRAAPRGALGPAEWADAFIAAGYSQAAWPVVAEAFAAFVHRADPAPVTQLYEDADSPGDDNGYAMYLGTECTDAEWPRDWSDWERDNTRVARDAPFLTWTNAWFNASCAFWPAGPARPVNARGRDLPGILVLGETRDAATPFEYSLSVRKRFRSSVLIATDGGSNHANSLAGNACVDDPIAAYLHDGSLPERQRGRGPDVVCEPAPEPEPEQAP